MMEGLYYLDENAFTLHDHVFINSILNCSKKDVNTWHYRLGHPCENVLKQICKIYPYVHDSYKDICEICHYSKQHKLPFPHKTSFSDNSSYVDIWDPISILLCMVINI